MSEKNIPIKNETPIPCKLILVGESGVGKTSIIARYLECYKEKEQTTIGAYFSNKTIIIDGFKINFEIWDTAGQEQYRSINNLFYRDAYICLMVFDITNKNSFINIKEYWYKAVSENGMDGVIFGVAGNKSDLYEDEEVNENEADEFCKSINACFKLTSARLNHSIDDIFMDLGNKFVKSDFMKELIPQYLNAKELNEINSNKNIKLAKEDNDKDLQKRDNASKNKKFGFC